MPTRGVVRLDPVRHPAVPEVAQPELTRAVVSPTEQAVVDAGGAGVGTTGADQRPVGGDADPGRGESLGRIAEPELTAVVISPAPQRVVGADGAGVGISGADLA